jgi:hypothetical protein
MTARVALWCCLVGVWTKAKVGLEFDRFALLSKTRPTNIQTCCIHSAIKSMPMTMHKGQRQCNNEPRRGRLKQQTLIGGRRKTLARSAHSATSLERRFAISVKSWVCNRDMLSFWIWLWWRSGRVGLTQLGGLSLASASTSDEADDGACRPICTQFINHHWSGSSNESRNIGRFAQFR